LYAIWKINFIGMEDFGDLQAIVSGETEAIV